MPATYQSQDTVLSRRLGKGLAQARRLVPRSSDTNRTTGPRHKPLREIIQWKEVFKI